MSKAKQDEQDTTELVVKAEVGADFSPTTGVLEMGTTHKVACSRTGIPMDRRWRRLIKSGHVAKQGEKAPAKQPGPVAEESR